MRQRKLILRTLAGSTFALLLALAACRARPPSLDREYREARSLLNAERYPLALKKTDEGLRQAESQNNLRVAWRFRLLKSEVLLGERQASGADSVLAQEPPDGPAWAECRGWRFLFKGRAAFYQARYQDAQELFDRAGERSRQSGSAPLAMEVELRQAILLVSEARFDEAETALRHVIAAASAARDTYLEATATGNLGYALLNASKYDTAITWFERARELHASLGATESIARDDGNLGWCYNRLGDYDRAQSQYEKARAGFAKVGNLFEEQIWIGNTGTLLYDTRHYSAAVAAYQRALEIARQVQNAEWVDRWTSSLAALTAQLGDWDTAEQYNNKALQLERGLHASPFEAMVLCTAGRIAVGRGRLDEAEHLFREAMERPARDPRFKLIAQTDLAALYQKTGQPRRAEEEFQAAVRYIDRLDAGLIKDDYKFGYLASLIEFYRLYIQFLMSNHQPERALEVVESSRTHVLAQRSGRREIVQSQNAAAYRNVARQTNAVLLEYWLGDDRSYLWVITPRRIRNYALPPAKTIAPLVESYRNLIMRQRNPLDIALDTGQKLYETLLMPAAEDLCAGCRVVIVPDQDLYSLNFEALPAPGEPAMFWIERANVIIAPSLNYLVDTSRRHSGHGTGLLIMGDPASPLPEFPKLEFAAHEIETIRATMGGAEAKVLEGSDAIPTAYPNAQPGRFAYLHFSAHASANSQSPLDSAVILSGPPDRCKLFARDVMSVPLTAELVTISACRSAGARTYAGEGLVGFAWAFLRAGARNVIAGLWDVNDRSTEELMSRLYAEIARGSSPAEALRTAKLSFIHAGGSYAKPFYWAPFQVYTGAIN